MQAAKHAHFVALDLVYQDVWPDGAFSRARDSTLAESVREGLKRGRSVHDLTGHAQGRGRVALVKPSRKLRQIGVREVGPPDPHGLSGPTILSIDATTCS